MSRLQAVIATTLLALPMMVAAQTPKAVQSGSDAAAATTDESADRPSLQDIRNFTRAFHIIRKAYVQKIGNDELINDAIVGMLNQLDPHSAWLDKDDLENLEEETSGEYSGLGIVVTSRDHQLVVIAPIDDTPAARAGLKTGDVILKIDGEAVDPQDIKASIDKLRGKPGSKITLLIRHASNDKTVTKMLTRATIRTQSVKIHELEPDYAYIRISEFQSDTGSELEDKLGDYIRSHRQPRGVILDLRSNPGGLVSAATKCADVFLDGGVVVSTRGRIKSSNVTMRAHPGDMLDGAPMVVLVNHGTASAAEILSGALRDHHRAIIMGRRTFGKGVVQTVIPIGKDQAIKLTTARYYTPDGTSIQAEGIVPDIVIPNLVVSKDDAGTVLVDAESDLPGHLHNENPDNVKATLATSRQDLERTSKLTRKDYALAQALNVLKGMALSRPAKPVVEQ